MSQSVLARELIELIERRGLLDQEIVDALRQQMEESGARITPEAVAKLLVDNGHLTRFQATKLIGELRSEQYDEDGDANEDSASEVVAVEAQPEEDLELSLGEEDAAEAVAVEAVEADAVAVEAVAVEAEAVAVEAVAVEAVPVEAVAVEAMPVEAVAVEAVPVSAVPVEATAVAVEAVPVDSKPKVTRRKKQQEPDEPEKNIWDSFKIYGVATLILICIVFGTFFYNYITRGNEAQYMERAAEFYMQESYSNAKQTYSDLLDNFGGDTENSSVARVRLVMCDLYQAKQNSSDPAKFLALAQAQLPTITDEVALDKERADLSGLLIEVAEQFTARAEKTEASDDKAAVIKQLDEHMKLIAEPTYVSTDVRKSMSRRLEAIDENRQRVIRDISRDRKLEATIGKMQAALEKKDTKTVYDERKVIIKEYPRLHNEARMEELILEASNTQRDLVANNGDEFEILKNEAENNIRKEIVLAYRKGNSVNSLSGSIYYVRVGGSVLAISAVDGKLLWRQFVGYRDEHPPTPLGDDPKSGVLLSEGSRLEIQKLAGANGQVDWRAVVGETFTKPLPALDTINFCTHSGKACVIDEDTGETVWAVQIPQPLEVSPSVYRVKDGNNAYLPGNHSNLYVLDHRDGSCIESHYIGHLEESIKTPPVFLMGHLFVFENNPDNTTTMHILTTDENGRSLKRASQSGIKLSGNVVVAPQVFKRRLVVLTNLGEVSVFEVEPNAEENKVALVAKQVASYTEPTLTQMAIDSTQMWVTGNEIVRYEIQINTGKIVRTWVKNTNDLFTAQPKIIGDALIHARVVSGTKGIRVSAVEAESGKVYWQTDIGVPTSAITAQRHAITSQASLYYMDQKASESGSTEGPIETPGLSGHGIELSDPIDMGENRLLFTNRTKPAQIAIYDPSREKQVLRMVQLALPDGKPNAPMIAGGGGLLVPLDTGRIALMNWQTGAMITNPFQPSLKPGEKVQWTNMAHLPNDPELMIVGDSRRKVYRIRVGQRIRTLSEAKLERDLLGPLTIIDKSVIAVAKTPSADMLLVLDSSNLKVTGEHLIEDGRVVWGPMPAGRIVVLATDDQKLRAFDSAGKPVWTADSPGGKPTGKPVVQNGMLVIAGANGWLVGLDPQTGESLGTTTIGQPIAGTPLWMGQGYLVPGSEGIVFAVSPPSKD